MTQKEQLAKDMTQRHPLQRLSSPSRDASALLHLAGLASFAYSFAYLVNNPNPINEAYGWHFQYLTIIGLSLATATFFVGLIADLTLSTRLYTLKNILSVASSPLACLISMLYWGLRAIDVRLVLPDWAPRLALQTDLSFHAVPAISLIVDLLLFSPPYGISALPALGLSSFIAISYWFWTEECYRQNGFYAYPIFDEAGYYGRMALFAGSAATMTLSTFCLQWLYSTVNGREMDAINKPKKSQ